MRASQFSSFSRCRKTCSRSVSGEDLEDEEWSSERRTLPTLAEITVFRCDRLLPLGLGRFKHDPSYSEVRRLKAHSLRKLTCKSTPEGADYNKIISFVDSFPLD